ncbi:MAG: hypothetical protein IIZ39_13635, partial [Blautia sp.]|nr:hypothetical protein [Blautia sp.]
LMPFFALNGLVTDDFERIGKKEVPFDEYDSNVESQLAEVKSKMFRLAFSIWMPKPFMVSKIETALKDPCPRFVRPHGYKMHPAARLMHLAEKMKGENNIAICRTKTRMLHLGYSEANGINIHIDDMLLEPFMVNPAKQNRKLGYVMPVSTCAELYETSDYFQQLAATGCYVYAGGFMTRNTEGGVLWKSEGAVLGAGANNDVSLYCLAQDKEYDEEKDAYAYSFGKQRYDEALEAHFDVPGEVFSDEEMERRKRDEDRVMAVPSIHGMLGMLWDEAKPRSHSISMLTLKILLSEDLARYDLDTMVAFCVDCHLMPWVSYCVLRRLGLEVEPGGHHAMILDCFYGMNMKTLNALLKESGRRALAIL